MWKGSLHIKRRTSNDARVGGKKRKEQNYQKSASKNEKGGLSYGLSMQALPLEIKTKERP
jgi:hypothetical protein